MNLKEIAGRRSIDWVHSGMRLGLGSGSTVRYALTELGARLADGRLHDVVGVPTSRRTAELARSLGIPLADLNDLRRLALTIDGADEVDPRHDLIKGLGGAALREKIVASVSDQLVIVVDASKLVPRLGTLAPVPVEVAIFGWQVTADALQTLGCEPVLRCDAGGAAVRTDGGNYLLDCHFAAGIADSDALAGAIQAIPGALGHGLFLGFAPLVIVGRPGNAEVRLPPPPE
ncbi:MAG: ribose 5-phosphate isomerase A [Ardenticatenaceae bacterium]|nr:ribose 5-phosphate isomerase A [Ardenticatenaceae bacterium]HBY93964.1 ribose 5-phosphate isomerase A [Chloroflexota bacterium]